MRLRDRIRIEVTPGEIWQLVGDPELWLGFHPKVASVVRRSGDPGQVDTWYDIEFEMKGRRMLHRTRIVERVDDRRLRLEATVVSPRDGEDRVVQVAICYELVPRESGVDVVETFDVVGHGLPRYVALIARLLTRYGRTMGSSSLMNLKQLLEHPARAPETADLAS